MHHLDNFVLLYPSGALSLLIVMKYTIALTGFVLLLSACSNPTTPVAEETTPVATETEPVVNCPESKPAWLVETAEDGDFYERFDYRIKKIVPDDNLIRFRSNNYDFVFCRSDGSWTVEPLEITSEQDEVKTNEELLAKAAAPTYETLELNGKSYQYRATLEPNPFPDFKVEPEKVVFELLTPGSEKPQTQTLYTLASVKQSKTGERLGLPKITAALTYDNRLFWTVSSEQGEGNGGIATIVSYEPEKNEISVIQPGAIKGEQITDLVIAGEPANPTFWMGTKLSAEGNPYLPAKGLVAYRPEPSNLKSGSVKAYDIQNSTIVGAIPTQLWLEKDQLWLGTGNGICRVKWVAADNPQNWSCWRFALMAELPRDGLPIYSKLLNDNEEADATIQPASEGEKIEVLWWSPLDYETRAGRYEVRYGEGFGLLLEQGASSWPDSLKSSVDLPPINWPGGTWNWQGNRFVRGFDQVGLNYVGGGPSGIGPTEVDAEGRVDVNTIRGDLELLKLTDNSTDLKYYSGWVEEDLLKPYLTVVPQQRPETTQVNPLKAVAEELKAKSL